MAARVDRRLLLLVAVAVAVGGFGWWLGRDTPQPALLWDATSYLALARWVAGEHTPFLGYLGQYHVGYPALLAPVAWLTSSLAGLVHGARVVNAVALAASTLALASIARRWFGGGRTTTSVLAGGAAALHAGLVLQVGFAWSEVAFAALALTAAALVPTGRRWTLVAASAAAYAVHPRGAVVVGATVLTLLVADRRRAWRPLLALVVLTAAVYAVNEWAFHHLWHAGAPNQSGDVVRAVLHPDLWGGLASRALGEVWYVSCAGLGLAPIGVVALVRWWRDRSDERRWLAWWVLWVTAGLFALTAAKFAQGGRVDQLAYGRYLDPVVPVLVLAGLAVLATVRWRVALQAVVRSIAVTALAGWLLEVTNGSALTGTVVPLNVLGVLALDADDTHLDVMAISVVALAALAVLAVASRRRLAVGVTALAAVFLVGDVSAQAVVDRFARNEAITFQLGTVLDLVAPGAPVSVDYDGYDGRAANLYELQAQHHAFHYFDSRLGQAPPDALIVDTSPADEPPVPGARIVFPEPNVAQVLWVAPGPLQAELVARGFVVADAGTALPDAFYAATVAVRPEGRRRVHVEVRRTTAIAPWVRPGSMNAAAGVVVLAVHVDGRTTTVSLPRTLFPGESASVEVPLAHPIPDGARVSAEVVAG